MSSVRRNTLCPLHLQFNLMTTRFRHSDLHQVIFNENMLKRLCQEVDSVQQFFSSQISDESLTHLNPSRMNVVGSFADFFAAQLIKFDKSKLDLLNFGQVKILIKSKSHFVVYFQIRIPCRRMRDILHSFLCQKLVPTLPTHGSGFCFVISCFMLKAYPHISCFTFQFLSLSASPPFFLCTSGSH